MKEKSNFFFSERQMVINASFKRRKRSTDHIMV